MTALEKYLRLESTGIWREGEAAAQEVLVSFGNATLVLSAFDETPLAHWALAATKRIDMTEGVALYTPDLEGFETLEIDDPQMIEAIARVSRLRNTRRRKRHWGRWLALLLLAASLSTAVYFAPSALRGQALRMTQDASARQLGWQMIKASKFDVCRAHNSGNTLKSMEKQLFPDGRFAILITKNGPAGAAFPGGLILVNAQALAQFQTPGQLADWVKKQAEKHPPLAEIFEQSRSRDLFIYITSGVFPPERLAEASGLVLATADMDVPTDTVTPPTERALLSAPEWAELRKICQE